MRQIVVMELVDDAVVPIAPGGMNAGLGEALFWIAFGVTVPVNRAAMSARKGDAVVFGPH